MFRETKPRYFLKIKFIIIQYTMTNLISVVTKYIKPYYTRIIMIISLIIFSYFAYYGYKKFYGGKYKESMHGGMDVANANRRNPVVVVYFFHADWCPHCKKAQPEWDKFMANYDGKEKHGHEIQCVDVNCTKETPDIKDLLTEYNIESYPTVKMVKDGKTIEFDSKIKETTLEKFIDTMLN